MNNRVQVRRSARALAIVAAAVVAVPLSGALVGAPGAGTAPGSAQAGFSETGIEAARIVGDADALDFLSRLEGASLAGEAPVPEAFEAEAGLPAASRDVRSSSSGNVIGCTLDLDADAAAEAVRNQMLDRGWSEVPLGQLEGATYVKDGGSLTWVLVTCTQIGNATSVVYRCVYA